jgi:predicted lipase
VYADTWADRSAAEAVGVKGKVHHGFLNYTTTFLRQFDEKTVLQDVRNVTFAGHSLGGAIAVLTAGIVAQRYMRCRAWA